MPSSLSIRAHAATETVASFRTFLDEYKDEITALQVLYSRPYNKRLTYRDVKELAEAIGQPPHRWTPGRLWEAYETLDTSKVHGSAGTVLTNVVSLVPSGVYHLYRVGWQAIPIISLITFLIGCIIAQQGFFHFRKFGADAYVVDMVGILVLREIGVLIVSIMVAGRSGSAYTAELGSMKMREEIDALRMMGFDPVEVLILPRGAC